MGIYDRDYERETSTWGGGGNESWNRTGYEGGGRSMTNTLLIAMGIIYLAQILITGFSSLFVLPADWLSQPWRIYSLLTYGLLHSEDNLGHLVFNGIALFFFGNAVEEKYGRKEFLAFFAAAVIFSGAIWSIAEASTGESAVLLGASGGIAGVLLLYALNWPNRQVYILGVLPIPAWVLAILFIGQDVLGAMSRSGNVAYSAHLGGALFGYLYYSSNWRLAGLLPTNWMNWKFPKLGGPQLRVHRPDDDDQGSDSLHSKDEKRLDAILVQIQRDGGQHKLSRSDKRFLEEASRRRRKERQRRDG